MLAAAIVLLLPVSVNCCCSAYLAGQPPKNGFMRVQPMLLAHVLLTRTHLLLTSVSCTLPPLHLTCQRFAAHTRQWWVAPVPRQHQWHAAR
jgi:hypothetical protein